MATGQCTLCGKALTSHNSSAEHIIPNAIGGRKRVVDFICQACNSDSGSRWDAELARQLNPISLLLGIARQSGDVPSQTFQTYGGGSVRVNADGTRTPTKPRIQVTTDGTTTRLHIEAATRRKFGQILKGLCRRYPQLRSLSLDDLVSTAEDRSYYGSEPMEIIGAFGGTESGRSLVKSAVALVFDAGVDPKQCDLALDYLLNEGKEACFGYYYDSAKDLLTNRPRKLPIHCVYVKGCSENSTLVGYVEFYSLWRIVLFLSESYTGSDFTHVYAVDPIKGEEVDISVNFDLSLSDLRDACEGKRYDKATFTDAIANVFDRAREIDFARAGDQAIKNAVEDAFANSGRRQGDALTDEQLRVFVKDVVDGMMPFIIHNMTLNDHVEDIIRQHKEEPLCQS